MVLTVFTGCKDYDVFLDDAGTRSPGLIFCVSGDKQPTRQSNAVVMPSGAIDECYLFPIDEDGRLLKSIEVATRLQGTNRYYDEDVSMVPIGTSSFICYAKEQDPFTNVYYPNASEEDLKFANGSTLTTLTTLDQDGEQGISTDDISFSPEVIYKEKTNVSTDEENPKYEPTVDSKATAIAAYLTDIANAIKAAEIENKDELFRQFINEGYPVPCSSSNVQILADWAEKKGITLPTLATAEDVLDYPANINLPDGAAVVMWQKQGNDYCFVPQPVTTTEANINSLDRFVYPASLWYYVGSNIKTSYSFLEEFFDDNMSWTDILDYFDEGDGIMEDDGINSVAIKDPMFFAEGCLQIGFAAPESLKDPAGTTITLKANENDGKGTFPLTGLFIAGQHEQDYRFTPKDDNHEFIIYDKAIPEGMSLGASATSSSETQPTVSTLSFQTIDYRSVRIALEFDNNSGEDFEGINGTVYNGTKFYIMGTINVPRSETIDYLNRAFTKDFITKGTVTISSLEKVYNYLPDLLDPRLEIGIKLVPDWIQSTTTNVPL